MVMNTWRTVGVCLMMVIWPSLAAADGLPEAISRCAAIKEDLARLRCYDGLTTHSQPTIEQESLSVDKQILNGEISEQEMVFDETSLSASTDEKEKKRGRWLGIQPYRRNYILPISFNELASSDSFDEFASNFQTDNLEIKFQLSFELPVWERIMGQDLDLYFAYTQLSFFQAYNQEYSSPFRDTVYEPEMGLNWRPELKFSDWTLTSARLSLNHQSNGRTEPLSRSWNRLIGQFEVGRDDLGLGLRVWHRFQEDEDKDDNPDIIDFMGYGEFFAGYDLGRHRLGFMLRNPFDYAAVQIGWSRLLSERVRLYVQYFNGYGESLIDYNQRVNRLGIGFLLNEWP